MTRLLIAFIALYATTSPAHEAQCQTREQVIATITAEGLMHKVWPPVEVDSPTVEVWANLTSGEWVMVVTQANGVSCPVSSGVAHRLVQEGE